MRVECIVMDDDSNDRTAEIAREMGAKVYNVTYDNNGNTWIGKSYACYLGALYSIRYSYIYGCRRRIE